MSTEDNEIKIKYKKQRIIGIVLIIVGIILIYVGLATVNSPNGFYIGSFISILGIVLFFIGICYVTPSSKRKSIKQ